MYIAHPKNDLEGIRSHNPAKLLCLSSPKTICGREIADSSTSREELNWPGIPFFGAKSATPTVG